MIEFNMYIANLGKYNNCELIGSWFTPPIDFENVKEKIGLTIECEEYAIHDFEAPITISEYTSINDINHIAELLEELPNEPYANCIGEVMEYWFSDLEDLVEHKDDLIFYHGCNCMEDVAYDFIEEGFFGEIPEYLKLYLDYSSNARDLEINGNFLITNNGIIEYV